MMGNTNEWMESPFGTSYQADAYRTIRGGAYNSGTINDVSSDYRVTFDPVNEFGSVGFRVAAVPEPASLLVFLLGSSLLARTKSKIEK